MSRGTPDREDDAYVVRFARSVLDPVVASIRAETSSTELRLELVPERLNQNLSLEQWSLENCAEVLREALGLKLVVSVQG